ncbi:MAG: hypothetical protein C0404_15105 [Verrucomicrobia bacterium]|nr:hypothetical protein [Verrucomicrobiota bacterium]
MDWSKQILRYALTALIGTCLFMIAIPLIRMTMVNKYIDDAENLLAANRPMECMVLVKRVELWASLFPEINVRLGYTKARCYGALGDMASVEKVAKEMVERYRAGMRHPVSVWETLQMLPTYGINQILSRSGLTEFCAFEYLLNELKNTQQLDKMENVAKDMLSYDSSNDFGNQARDYVYKKRGLDMMTKDQTNSASWSTPMAVDSRSKQRAKMLEHYEKARKHMTEKRWDDALAEIELALTQSPDNPALLLMKKTASSRGMKWGVVKRDGTRVYDQQGNLLQVLEPGTLLEISGAKDSSAGEASLCKTNDSRNAVFVLSRDLDIRNGILAQASDREKALRVHYAQVSGELDKLTVEITSSRVKENPHYADYEKADREYNLYWKKAKDLQKKRDSATGPDRMKYTDELYAMKGDSVRIGQSRELAKKKFDEWQSQHPINLSSNSKLESLRAELADVRQQITSLENGQ